ncbi:MAG: sensor histidine kinase [Burkholderiales bacterium]|nr:sensor histidine kinase [Burkholderiales bacterium]
MSARQAPQGPLGFWALCWLLLVWWPCSQVWAQTAPVATLAHRAPALYLETGTRHVSLEGHLSTWVDDSAEMPLPLAKQQAFRPMASFKNAGFTPAAHWFRAEITRAPDAPARWLLVLGEPYLDQIDVWAERPDGSLQHARFGDHGRVAERAMASRQYVWELDLADAEPLTLWVRVSSNSMLTLTGSVWSPQAMLGSEARESVLWGLLLGVMLVVVLFFGGLGVLLKDAVLVAYAAFVSAQGLRNLVISGHAQFLLDPATPWMSDVWQALSSLGPVLTGTVWAIYLVNMRVNFPLIFRFYLLVSAATAVALCSVSTPLYRLFAPALLQLGGVVSLLSVVLLAVLWWRQRQLELVLLCLGALTTVVVALLQVLTLAGGIDGGWFGTGAYQLGTVLHMGFMSVALGLRLRQSQREKAHVAQQHALAQERQAEQRRFIAVLSHEFRNPLASIDRAANLLQVKLAGLTQVDSGRLSGIRDSVRRLGNLVDGFLVTGAADAHQLHPSLKVQSVRDVLNEVVDAQGSELKLRLCVEVTPPALTFPLDARLIGIALGNLVGNAWRYSGDTGLVSVSAQLEGGDLCLTVADQGPGMSAEDLARLGTAYHRAGSSVGKQGTGLGYFFSRSIVEAHGGTLQASNRPGGRGLMVCLRLPCVGGTQPHGLADKA